MSEPVLIKKGSEIELKVESLAFGGMGLAKIDDFVVLLKMEFQVNVLMLLFIKRKRVLLRQGLQKSLMILLL